ncbi:MAG: LLM class flavin-dependent oxidoreductase [Hyphomicrobiales bacterium]|nr:LLM class flavin-dependent oxidoreductase [Hyphomicrobiales bacterium]|tara:strand:- start:249 stop:1346 length:1098 start_codon:yes stop_codon:yes gene_type:complete
MRLGFFTMPVHPEAKSWYKSLQEDRQAVILADKLGYYDVFIGEHLTDKSENITNSMIFLSSLISETNNIKLGTGTSNLSHMHPVLIASHAAMLDHLSQGRFIFGISPGALKCDAEVLGIINEDRGQIFAEAIDVILEIWKNDPPYNINLPNNRFKVSTLESTFLEVGVGYLQKPYQKPLPEIVGTVVAPYSKGIIAMGEKNFHPISAHFLLPKWIKTHWANYKEGKRNMGLEADISDWRIARTIFVNNDSKVANNYGKNDKNSPYRFFYEHLYKKLERSNRLSVFKSDQNMDDSDLTIDNILDQLVICGDVNQVIDQILSFREQVGDFGELLYGGVDWLDEPLARKSMELMAERVVPEVNKHINK